jgi:hypothetical protein
MTMNFDDTVIPLAVFASIVAVVWLIISGIVRIFAMKTLRLTAKDSPDSLALVAERLAVRNAATAEAVGLIGIALGAALAVAGLIGGPETRVALLQAVLLPGFIGAALVARRWIAPPKVPTLPAPDTAE